MPRKQRRRSWGSITESARGKYVLRWIENTPDGRKRKSRTFYGTYKEADAELARIRVRVGDDAPVPTIGQAYEMWWLPWMRKRIEAGKAAQTTANGYTRAWSKVCAPKWGRVPVDSVKPAEVQRWLDGLTSGDARTAMPLMRKVMDFAVKYEVAEANKFRVDYEMPTRKARERSKDVYDLARANAALDALRGARIEAAFILSCFGSCRPGEALGVMVGDVAMVEAHGVPVAAASIERAMPDTGAAPVDRLKNAQSVRTVCVPGPYAERLAAIAEERRAVGSKWLSDRGDGLPMNRRMLNHEWARDAVDYIPFANLRNSWRTFAQAEWRMDYDLLEVLMGHVLPGVTGRHYLRMSPAQLADQVGAAYARFLFS
ncbi:hypothetical protein [uncultured Slackia sp.]|uniref:hypothetical protein n=1 Tax=uncultured Slackia sp. TaxID=665903 RepID=UPI0026DF9A8F|nr:hypothetical protein [uncultured Slackia sp.]